MSEVIIIRRSFHHLTDKEVPGEAGIIGTETFPQPDIQALRKQQPSSVEDTAQAVKEETEKHLKYFGKALKEIEGRRRKNFLLQNMDILDLNESDDVLAQHAIRNAANERPVKALLKQLEATLAPKIGSRTTASNFVEMLKKEGRTIADKTSFSTQNVETNILEDAKRFDAESQVVASDPDKNTNLREKQEEIKEAAIAHFQTVATKSSKISNLGRESIVSVIRIEAERKTSASGPAKLEDIMSAIIQRIKTNRDEIQATARDMAVIQSALKEARKQLGTLIQKNKPLPMNQSTDNQDTD